MSTEKARRSTSGSIRLLMAEPSNEPGTPASPNANAEADPNAAATPVGHDADEAGHADEHQAGRRGLLGFSPAAKTSAGTGQDRATSAERAERQADEEADR